MGSLAPRQMSKLAEKVPRWLKAALVATTIALATAGFVGYGIWFQRADAGAGTPKMYVRAEGVPSSR